MRNLGYLKIAEKQRARCAVALLYATAKRVVPMRRAATTRLIAADTIMFGARRANESEPPTPIDVTSTIAPQADERMGELRHRKRVAAATLRSTRLEDAVMHQEFVARLNPDDLRSRSGSRVRDVPDTELHTLANLDLDRETTFVAVMLTREAACEIVREVRLHEDLDRASLEFAIAVRSDLQGRDLSRMLSRRRSRRPANVGGDCSAGWSTHRTPSRAMAIGRTT
jgi:hypothetical protein